ncbi:MAG: DUF1549 and DUF1553 domain-containing protein, partial [Limisphaerales bacterium]
VQHEFMSRIALILFFGVALVSADESNWPARTNHWSFHPIQHPKLPVVKDGNWARNPIDRFVLKRIEAEGLTPASEADRFTLIRRVHLDLIGLPPTIEEVDAFVNDKDPDAFRKVVRSLLDNEHYGEKWGRHWLDQARYADSNGYTIDSPRVMWPYRDWVIKALNRDLPFDQFTIEQIAGDLLPKPTQDQIIATGFHRNTLINQEGGTDDEQFRVESVVDRVNTTGTVWLGLSVGCAQCHTHKFDPITIEDYYRFYAFFNTTEDKNNTGPTVRVRKSDYASKVKVLNEQLADAKASLAKYDKAPSRSRAAWERELSTIDLVDEPWQRVTPTKYTTRGKADIKVLEDNSLFVGPKHPSHDIYTVAAKTDAKQITAVRLDVIADKRLPKNGPGLAGNGNFVMTGFEVLVGGKPVRFHKAVADHEQPRFPIENVLDGKNDTGWAINRGGKSKKQMNVDHWAIFYPDAPVALDGSVAFRILHESARNSRYMVGRFAVSLAEIPEGLLTLNSAKDLIAAVKTPAKKRSKKQKQLLLAEYQNQDPDRKRLSVTVERLESQKSKLDAQAVTTMVMREGKTMRESNVHLRGDFLRKGDKVSSDVPAFLPQLPKDVKRDRMALAKWLVHPDNPLTARVTVNRVWMRYFGTGLVETDNDFGTQGSDPTHPELLDWLAGEFVRQGWSQKKLHELIVTSATYRQASHRRPAPQRVDPVNRLLARQNRIRVDAELVRDVALAVSGKLNRTIGGASVHPPQPDGVYNFTQSKKKWNVVEGPQKYRRTMYTFFYRSAPYPMLTTFDVPDLSATCTSRPRSNTPLQSLAMANDEGIFEMVQALVEDELKREEKDDEARLSHLFRRCLARPPASWELSRLQEYLEAQRREFADDEKAAKQVAMKNPKSAAWVMVARAVMNLDEFITRE